MKPPRPEFSRPLEVARVPALGSFEKIAADAGECVELAQRLKLPKVHGLWADLRVKPWRGGGFKVSGEVRADIEQESVISLELFRSEVRFSVERYFLQRVGADEDEEVDVIGNGELDLGEIAVETLGLELDPYPRKAGEVFQLAAPQEEAPPVAKISPFAVLGGRDRGGKRS